MGCFYIALINHCILHRGVDLLMSQQFLYLFNRHPFIYSSCCHSSTDEEKEKYRDGLIATCKVYCHIDYDDDMEILELMFDVTMQEMTELIPNFDQYSLTSRQKLLAFISVKELYDNRDKYRSDTKLLASAASSMLLKEIYGGAAQ